MRIEVHGLEVFALHGVGEEERRRPQRLVFDVEVEGAEPAADDIDATIDYREIRDVVLRVSDTGTYSLLESLAGAVADAVAETLPVDGVRVCVRKPGVSWAKWTAASVTRGAIAS